jgi:glycosyltransferase involved in cell wall biosynthesis
MLTESINNMISFITIGQNEGLNLMSCIKSIYRAIEYCNLKDYEIIYVDSNSADNSIEIVSGFKEVMMLKVTGKCNAALARNIGASEAKGEILFFIDGDIELYPSFLHLVLPEGNKLIYPFISGNLLNRIHDSNGNLVSEELGYDKVKASDKKTPISGGVFLIERELWDSAGGMRTKYTSGEDPDLSLRLARSGMFLIRRDEILGIHHTISYYDDKRFWARFFLGIPFYGMVLFRDHLFNPIAYRHFLRIHFTWFYLLLALIASFAFKNYFLLLTYPALVIARNIIGKRLRRHVIKNSFRVILTEIGYIFAFFFFFPHKLRSEYTRVR